MSIEFKEVDIGDIAMLADRVEVIDGGRVLEEMDGRVWVQEGKEYRIVTYDELGRVWDEINGVVFQPCP